MGDVVDFDGYTKRDINPGKMLQAMAKEVTDGSVCVAVVLDEEGQFNIHSSTASYPVTGHMLSRALHRLHTSFEGGTCEDLYD